MDFKCSVESCKYSLRKSKVCSKRDNGVFYVLCDSCNKLHRVYIDPLELTITVAPVPREELDLAVSKIESSYNGKIKLRIKNKNFINDDDDDLPF